MEVVWGGAIVAVSLLGWGGQAISWVAPATAVRWSLMEAEDSVEPTYWQDIRGEAMWDTLTLWTMVVAGALLVFDQPAWAYFGLVGGGMYLYFGGRGLVTRFAMKRHGLRIGEPRNVTIGLAFLSVWAVMGLVTIIAAAVALPLP